MRKKVFHAFIFITAGAVLAIVAIYIILSLYYRNGFSYGTWINGIYCTGKSVDEVNDILTSQFSYSGLEVKGKDGKTYKISADDIGYTFDFRKALQIYLEQQNSWLWPENISAGRERQLLPVVTYDGRLLSSLIDESPFVVQANKEKPEVKLYHSDKDGYWLVNNSRDLLDTDKASSEIKSAVKNSEQVIDLDDAGCYYDLEITSEMQQDIDLYEKISRIQDQDIEYIFGTHKEKIDKGIGGSFVRKNKDGSVYIDEAGDAAIDSDAVEAYLDSLAKKYNTVGTIRKFHATSGRDVSILGGTYGNMIDKKAELVKLESEIKERKKVSREPIYKQKALIQGEKDDIGDTYIEVDMSSQMLYYYKDGNIDMSTPVVTGNISLKRGTPQGVDFVAVKQKDRTLHGINYTSHVKLWMQVYKGIGIHDSSWRDDYGGDIYLTDGSHGCVNTPYDKMKELYDKVDVGTPVVMFY